MKRTATSVWKGKGINGSGKLSTQSKVLHNSDYSFGGRFEEGKPGTNPEELIGAALAGCFNMALAVELEKADYLADELHTTAVVHLNKKGDGYAITEIDLNLNARSKGIDKEEFMSIARGAKENCPVSQFYKGAKINLSVDFNK